MVFGCLWTTEATSAAVNSVSYTSIYDSTETLQLSLSVVTAARDATLRTTSQRQLAATGAAAAVRGSALAAVAVLEDENVAESSELPEPPSAEAEFFAPLAANTPQGTLIKAPAERRNYAADEGIIGAEATTAESSELPEPPSAEAEFFDPFADNTPQGILINDPYENSNRRVAEFNDQVDRYLFLPLAQGYDYILPGFVQDGVTNFFNNINTPATLFNDLLQLNMVDFYIQLARFGINSFVGLFGLFDVAGGIGLRRNTEDLGQTLGSWGVPPGRYLVLPGFGPSNERDFLPQLVEPFITPLVSPYLFPNLLPISFNTNQQIALTALNLINLRNNLRGVEENIFGDRYIFIRDTYLQNRRYQVYNGEVPLDDTILQFGDDPDDLENLDELENLDDLSVP